MSVRSHPVISIKGASFTANILFELESDDFTKELQENPETRVKVINYEGISQQYSVELHNLIVQTVGIL
jgi:hypothetical protein